MKLTDQKHYAVELTAPLRLEHLGILAGDDADEHELRIDLTHGGAPADLTGAAVSVCMVRADRTTLTWAGTVAGAAATVPLPAQAHRVNGAFVMAVALTQGNVRRTILRLEGCVAESQTDSVLAAGESAVPSYAQLLALLPRLEQAGADAAAAAAAASSAAELAHAAAGVANDAAMAAGEAGAQAASAAVEALDAAEEARQAAREGVFDDTQVSGSTGWTSEKISQALAAKEDAIGILPVSRGGTGATNAAEARTALGLRLGNQVFSGSVSVAPGGTITLNSHLAYGRMYLVRFEYRASVATCVGGTNAESLGLTAVRANGDKRYLYVIDLTHYDASTKVRVNGERVVLESGKLPALEPFSVQITGIWELF